MKLVAWAHWEGDLQAGKGILTTQSGELKKTKNGFFSFFEGEETGSGPEELLAATHAGCFTMAVCSLLTKRGLNPKVLDTEATVTLETYGITAMHLFIRGYVRGLDADYFTAITKDAERTCMISKILRIPISTEAKLEHQARIILH